MVAIWDHIIVSFKINFGKERVHWNFDILDEMHQWVVNWSKESLLIGGCRLNGLRIQILASQEQMALVGLTYAAIYLLPLIISHGRYIQTNHIVLLLGAFLSLGSYLVK